MYIQWVNSWILTTFTQHVYMSPTLNGSSVLECNWSMQWNNVPFPARLPHKYSCTSKHVQKPYSVHVWKPYSVHVRKPYSVHVWKPYSVDVQKPYSVHVHVQKQYSVDVQVLCGWWSLWLHAKYRIHIIVYTELVWLLSSLRHSSLSLFLSSWGVISSG